MAPKTALLVIDMQNVFASMTKQALPNIERLIVHFQHSSSPSLFTQHGHSPDELNGKKLNQLVRKWGASGSIAHGSTDWQFQPAMKNYVRNSRNDEGEATWPRIISKNTYDAFINTDLQQVLEEADIERVLVCGVMTDCCCDTTARSAFNRGFDTWLISDACGSANETQHRAGLNGFEFACGQVLSTEEAIELLKQGS